MDDDLMDLATARFWRFVDKRGDDECWPWIGSRKDKGYGQFCLRFGLSPVRAHRFSYILAFGPLEDGVVVRHTCDNPPCVNPAHLLAGSKADNSRDMVERGRHVAWNLAKTHCPRGHLYDEENTYRSNNGKRRSCRACQRARNAGRRRFQS